MPSIPLRQDQDTELDLRVPEDRLIPFAAAVWLVILVIGVVLML